MITWCLLVRKVAVKLLCDSSISLSVIVSPLAVQIKFNKDAVTLTKRIKNELNEAVPFDLMARSVFSTERGLLRSKNLTVQS